MAPAYFLEIDGIPGESRDPEHSGELELTSFSWGESAGPRDLPTTVSFTLPTSSASPALFLACASGRRIAHAVLTMREGERGGDAQHSPLAVLRRRRRPAYATAGSCRRMPSIRSA